jgi:hypothetical protein
MGFYVACSATKANHHARAHVALLDSGERPRTVSTYAGGLEAALESADVTRIFVFFNSLISRLENAACTFTATAAGSDA